MIPGNYRLKQIKAKRQQRATYRLKQEKQMHRRKQASATIVQAPKRSTTTKMAAEADRFSVGSQSSTAQRVPSFRHRVASGRREEFKAGELTVPQSPLNHGAVQGNSMGQSLPAGGECTIWG